MGQEVGSGVCSSVSLPEEDFRRDKAGEVFGVRDAVGRKGDEALSIELDERDSFD